MSVVFEARQLASGRLVALKVLQQEFRYGKALRDLLREVAESVSRLRHPNVVQVYECGERGGRPYFVMELLSGGSLERRSAGQQLPIREAAALVRTLAQTLDAVHWQGILHGNLKPSKVLLTGDGTIKVTGFIVARHQRALEQEVQASGTMSGLPILGTPRYMAPEQLAGDIAAVGPATDIYALGLILYELLTGWLPFRAATLWEMMAQVQHEPPQPPRELRADLPADMEAICLHCLAKRPDQRYPSAGFLAEDLDRFLAGEPVLLELAVEAAPQAPAAQASRQAGAWARFTAWLTGRPSPP
jgi:serine/threonine-protein kinase